MNPYGAYNTKREISNMEMILWHVKSYMVFMILHIMFYDDVLDAIKTHELSSLLADRFYFKNYACISIPGIWENLEDKEKT